MKKSFVLMLTFMLSALLLLMLSGCAAPNTIPDNNTPLAAVGGDSGEMEESEIFKLADSLMQEGQTIFWWYHDAYPSPDTLELDRDSELEVEGQTFVKVGKFKTIAELKAATEAVFTIEFCEAHFYDKIDVYQKFKEIEGALYSNISTGGLGWDHSLPKEYILKTANSGSIVLTAICDSYDFDLNAAIEAEFELTLNDVGGSWRLDSWYNYTTDGFVPDMLKAR
jgi:hypothetical protein